MDVTRTVRPDIRARSAADLDACVRILGAVHRRYGYPVNWPADPQTWLEARPGHAWVATVEGSYAGHVAITLEGGSALVERLFVDPARSGTGIGRALLRHAVAEARTRVAEVLLDVVAAEDAANGLYRAEGWTELSRVPISWGPTPASTLTRFRAP